MTEVDGIILFLLFVCVCCAGAIATFTSHARSVNRRIEKIESWLFNDDQIY